MSRLALFLAGAALLAACREQPVAPDSAAKIWFAATGGKGDYVVKFDGDIASDPFPETGSAKEPFRSLSQDQVTLRFVVTTGTSCFGTTTPGWGDIA